MNRKHCTEQQLDLYLKLPERLSEEEQDEIRVHVSECKLCAENLETLQRFYADLEQRLHAPAAERDRAFAENVLYRNRTRLLPLRGVVKRQFKPLLEKVKVEIEPYRRPLPQRIFRYLQVHPLRVAGGTSLAALALMAAFLVIRPGKDTYPSHARIKDYVLSVYDKKGEVLWTKSVVGMPDVTSETLWDEKRLVLVVDIDGDTGNEVLLTGATAESSLARDTLYCFNSDGALRWKHGTGPAIVFGEMDFTPHSQWVIGDFFTVQSADAGKPRLFALANAEPYFPAKLFELEPKDGRELQVYWHPGNLNHALTLDVDQDGWQEIILGGINNAYRRACLAVLDPSQVSGYGPATAEFAPKALDQGREEYYLLFPLTKLGQILGTNPYNQVSGLRLNQDGSFIAKTKENPGAAEGGGILYTIAPGMKVVAAIGNDPFLKLHERLVREGKRQEQLEPEYWEQLKDSVQYWDGKRFVHEPTMNRLYLGSESLP